MSGGGKEERRRRHIYVYIYIYMHVCVVLNGPSAAGPATVSYRRCTRDFVKGATIAIFFDVVQTLTHLLQNLLLLYIYSERCECGGIRVVVVVIAIVAEESLGWDGRSACV